MRKLADHLFHISFLVLAAGSFTHGQSTSPASTTGEDWNLIHQENGVKIFTKTADCTDTSKGIASEYLLIKVANHNPEPITVRFSKAAWYDGKCTGCDASNREQNVELVIEGNSEREGNCTGTDRSLKVFAKMIDLKNVRSLTAFKLLNVDIMPSIGNQN